MQKACFVHALCGPNGRRAQRGMAACSSWRWGWGWDVTDKAERDTFFKVVENRDGKDKQHKTFHSSYPCLTYLPSLGFSHLSFPPTTLTTSTNPTGLWLLILLMSCSEDVVHPQPPKPGALLRRGGTKPTRGCNMCKATCFMTVQAIRTVQGYEAVSRGISAPTSTSLRMNTTMRE
jgi:hypothetical protein